MCSVCGESVENADGTCPKCSANLVDVRTSDDDEYLSKLLGWGDEAEKKLKKKIEEKQKAMNTLKKMTKSSDDDSNLDTIKEPLDLIHDITEERLNEIDKEIKQLTVEVEEEESEDAFVKIQELTVEREHISSLMKGMDYMKDAFDKVFLKQQEELDASRAELKVRVDEFKKVVKKKEEEKKRINIKISDLEAKEDELKKWEIQLRSWEEDLKAKEEKLGKLKDTYEEGERKLEEIEEELPTGNKITQEEWLKEQKKIQRELFKLKDMWSGDEEGIQDIDEISSDNIVILKEGLKRKEAKWKGKISELEEEIEKIKKEKDTLQTGKELANVEIEEIQKILSVLDNLLGNLPEDMIQEFAKSKDFELYEKVMESLGL